MNNIIYRLAITLFAATALAQDRTTVKSTSIEISDNLDLKALASIFGDSENLEDFERRLNDPRIQISNLDLNNDRQVDYLRVIESVEGVMHLIIVQSVLDRDVYQDVATIEVERDRNNQVRVQVVGDVYMYGQNYIYEPVYVTTPTIYDSFYVTSYRPYCSGWYFNFYPSYYYAWTPLPIFRYRNHVHNHINIYNNYNYVNTRRSYRAIALYNSRRSNAYERQFPTQSFAHRNAHVSNRYELNQTGSIANVTHSSVTANNRTEFPRASTRSESFSPRPNTITPKQISTPRVNTRSNVTSGSTTRNAAAAWTNSRSQSSIARSGSNARVKLSGGNVRPQNQAKRADVGSKSILNTEQTPLDNSNTRALSANRMQRMELQNSSNGSDRENVTTGVNRNQIKI